MSYAMRGDYTLKHLAYGVHHIYVQLVEIFEAPSAKYVGKGISRRASLINLCPGNCGQFIEPWVVQQYIHTPWM